MNDRPSMLTRYDAACRAIAEARSVDEVKPIRDWSIAWAAYARQAKNRDLEADCIEIRLRATRRLDELRRAQKETVGLATGGEHGGRVGIDGLRKNPSNARPTLASQGIDKNLSQQARVLGAMDEAEFEATIVDARDKVARAVRNAVREVEIRQEREAYSARTKQGGSIADLIALADSGYRASVIFVDVPSRFAAYSSKGRQRSAERHYDTMSVAELTAMAPVIQALTGKDCALLYWTSGPHNAEALEIIKAWGFDYKSWVFVWVKAKPSSGVLELEDLSSKDLHWGGGFNSRGNVEAVLLAKRGSPRRLAADVHQVIIAPAGEHSEKPDEAYARAERLYPGPYLELFARRPRAGWTTWGDELPPLSADYRGGGGPFHELGN
jgi:N6-adenosine-specific RNA methylase IME4